VHGSVGVGCKLVPEAVAVDQQEATRLQEHLPSAILNLCCGKGIVPGTAAR